MDAGYSRQTPYLLYVKMEWTRIVITDPIKWWERCRWLETNCSQYYDDTDWGMWQIGQGDIIIYVPEKEAVMYYLIWS
jgi:hypothetical protein